MNPYRFSFLISDEVTVPTLLTAGVAGSRTNRGQPSSNQSSLVAPERASDRLLEIVVNDLAEA
jgi:hypothetical protein